MNIMTQVIESMQIYLLQKRVPTPFKPGKCRQTDPKKIYASKQELRERYLYHAESGK